MTTVITKKTAVRMKPIITKAGGKKNARKKRLGDYYGKLKGIYGDGLAYQKKLRSEWK